LSPSAGGKTGAPKVTGARFKDWARGAGGPARGGVFLLVSNPPPALERQGKKPFFLFGRPDGAGGGAGAGGGGLPRGLGGLYYSSAVFFSRGREKGFLAVFLGASGRPPAQKSVGGHSRFLPALPGGHLFRPVSTGGGPRGAQRAFSPPGGAFFMGKGAGAPDSRLRGAAGTPLFWGAPPPPIAAAPGPVLAGPVSGSAGGGKGFLGKTKKNPQGTPPTQNNPPGVPVFFFFGGPTGGAQGPSAAGAGRGTPSVCRGAPGSLGFQKGRGEAPRAAPSAPPAGGQARGARCL